MIKRINRTNVLMADLEKSASAGVKEAAIMLKVIAREMVSRRYSKSSKQKQFDDRGDHWGAKQTSAERFLAKGMARQRFTGGKVPFQTLLRAAKQRADSGA